MSSRHPLSIFPLGERELVMTRDFDAPRELVYDAWTKPELVQRWLHGPEGWRMSRCEIDLRVGGAYRFEMTHTESGEMMGWGGVYTELSRPSVFANTERFDVTWSDGESLVTTVLTENDGVTHLEATITLESEVARDTVLQSGMEEGVGPSYDHLDRVLAELKAGSTAHV